MTETLVLSDPCRSWTSCFSTIENINAAFQLGVEVDLTALLDAMQDVLETLEENAIGSTDDLMFVALQTSAAGHPSDPLGAARALRVWRKLGYPDIAAVIESWYALADQLDITVRYKGTEDEHPFVSNASEIDPKCDQLRAEHDRLRAELPFTQDDVGDILCDMFNLEFRPPRDYRTYWIERILAAPGFANYAPRLDDDGLPIHSPCDDWVTKRHVMALNTHGYQYRFAFWAEPAGDARGDLWIQTDKGPLVLTDTTDAVSLRTNFPVQVSNLEGRRMFQLKARDLEAGARGGGLLSRLLRKK